MLGTAYVSKNRKLNPITFYPFGPLCQRKFSKEQAELSWGSVLAETVRLQRQIDARLMNIHLKFTEFRCLFGPKKI